MTPTFWCQSKSKASKKTKNLGFFLNFSLYRFIKIKFLLQQWEENLFSPCTVRRKKSSKTSFQNHGQIALAQKKNSGNSQRTFLYGVEISVCVTWRQKLLSCRVSSATLISAQRSGHLTSTRPSRPTSPSGEAARNPCTPQGKYGVRSPQSLFGLHAVFRTRIRDQVPFWLLDPGSGIGLFRVPDLGSWIPNPYFWELGYRFLVKNFNNSLIFEIARPDTSILVAYR